MFNRRNLISFFLVFCLMFSASAQKKPEAIVADSLTVIANQYAFLGKIPVLSVTYNTDKKQITVVASDLLAQMPFRPDIVSRIYQMLSGVFNAKYPGYSIVCQSDKKNIEDYIPNIYRTDNIDKQRIYNVVHANIPLVTDLSKPYLVNSGLQNRHIALWQSHGRYYDQSQQKWVWQRARLFNTVEDLYTQSYVLPFLVPMLENAGANVLLPRERDAQTNEVIIDEDNKWGSSRYHDHSDRKSWKTGTPGFGNTEKVYTEGENPFTLGTYRYVPTIEDSDEMSYAEWTPDIPEDGYYAVYVSYKTLPQSAPDARYTVFHRGGKTFFRVNQTMDGGTWVYLGTFNFSKGKSSQCRIVLSNFSQFPDKVVSADAVKIGGGMGNVGRKPDVEDFAKKLGKADTAIINKKLAELKPMTSGYPRYTEGARYWLQWAGVPDSIYSRTKGKNDYSDDFQSRGFWVNYISGGSSVNPGSKGLGVPIDMSLAFHSDAGSSRVDSIIGTLGICTVTNTEGKQVFPNGVSRWASRDLTDIVQSQIVSDVRATYAQEWVRRGLWNKSYSESRVPEMPAMLLEILSHQNFADMRYGLDPRFRFTVSRAIYKGILRYLSYNSGKEYVVQPLPVSDFSTRFIAKNKVELQWKPQLDSIEPTAKPTQYVVYTRIEDGGFNNGIVTKNNKIVMEILPGKVYSFKVAALNNGGESFPSEILSVCRANYEKGVVMIVNGFERISGPGSFVSNGTTAGFLNDDEAAVPYISDYAYVGKQYDFNRNKKWISDDDPGFGASYSNYENKVIAGNTFDFAYIHGESVRNAGFSFVSSSVAAVKSNAVDLRNYKIVDLILGKQKQTYIGNGKKAPEFKTFPLDLQKALRNYCLEGGSLLVSGAYVGSDFYKNGLASPEDLLFADNVLKIKYKANKADMSGKVQMVSSPFLQFGRNEFSYYNEPNDVRYFAESVDAIEPASGALTVCRYEGTNMSAGVAYAGKYKVCTFGFPLEIIKSDKDRNRLMSSALTFLNVSNKK